MMRLKPGNYALVVSLIFLFSCIPWPPVQAAPASTDFFDQASYEMGDTLNLAVYDPAMNIISGADVLVGNLHSSATDQVGIVITMNETLADDGHFTAQAVIASSSAASQIGAQPGETLTFSYTAGSNIYGDTATILAPALSYSSATFTEAAADNGTIQNSLTLTLANETFTVAPGSNMTAVTHYNASNVPAGLTAVISVTSSTTATLQLTGAATSHTSANSIGNMQIAFTNAAFTGNNSAQVAGSTRSDLAVTFVSTAAAPTCLSARTNGSGSKIELTFSKAMSNPAGKQAQFTVNDGSVNTVSSIELNSSNNYICVLNLNRVIDDGDTVTVTYTAGSVTAGDGGILANFGPMSVYNVVDDTPSASYSGITNTVKGSSGTLRVTLTITVKNSDQAALDDYDAYDFDVEIDNGDTLDFRDSEFSSFTNNGDGTYTVVYYGEDYDTSYYFDIWADGVKIETDYEVVTPDDYDGDDDEDEEYYTLTDYSKTIHYHGATIYFPDDAWTRSSTEIYVDYSTNTHNLDLDDDQIFASDIYIFTKERSGDFDRDITITLPFDDYDIDQDDYTISIYWYDTSSGTWKELDNVDVDWSDEEVSGKTDHFTKFALIATEINSNNSSNSSSNQSNNNIWQHIPAETTLPSSSGFPDTYGNWAEFYILAMQKAGVVDGCPDGLFHPEWQVTRAEFATMLVRAFNLSGSSDTVFPDTANHWAREAISIAAENGVVEGYSSREFAPNDLITREQMASAIVNTVMLGESSGDLTFSDAGLISPWARKAVAQCVSAGIIVGNNNYFNPQDYATRAEAVTIIYRAWE